MRFVKAMKHEMSVQEQFGLRHQSGTTFSVSETKINLGQARQNSSNKKKKKKPANVYIVLSTVRITSLSSAENFRSVVIFSFCEKKKIEKKSNELCKFIRKM